jgi:hypothetical protein
MFPDWRYMPAVTNSFVIPGRAAASSQAEPGIQLLFFLRVMEKAGFRVPSAKGADDPGMTIGIVRSRAAVATKLLTHDAHQVS